MQMKAAIHERFGPPSVLQLKKVAVPHPRKNELLIKVHASSVTSGTIWVRRGSFPGSWVFTAAMRLMFGITRPRVPILGFEFAGVVEQTGEEVRHFKRGDAVYGTTSGLRAGAYAEYVCVPELWKLGVVSHRPQELSFDEAAVLPIGAMTAWHLLQKAALHEGQKVLIYGASGSVGTYALQIARSVGVEIVAASSERNFALTRSLGASECLDYHLRSSWKGHQQFDVVFDAVGKLPKKAGRLLLRKGGRFISVKSMTIEKLSYLEQLHQLIGAGELRPVIDRIYPLHEVADAHAYVEQGHKRGNVVIRVANAQ